MGHSMRISEHNILQSAIEMTYEETLKTGDDLRLPEWGKWTKDGNDLRFLGYPACTIKYTRSGKGTYEPNLSKIIGAIDDESAMAIHRAVNSLPPYHRLVIEAIYVERFTSRQLPAKLKMTRGVIEHYQHQAIGMLWGKLR